MDVCLILNPCCRSKELKHILRHPIFTTNFHIAMSYSFKFSSIASAVDLIQQGEEKASASEAVKGGESSSSSSSHVQEPVPGSYPCFVPSTKENPMSDMTIPDLANQLVEANLVSPFKALTVPGTTKTWSWTQMDIRQPPDKIMYSSLREAKLYKFIEPSLSMYRSNGTRRGMFQRLFTKLAPLATKVNPDVFKRLLPRQTVFFPLAPAAKWEERPTINSVYLQKLSTHSSPGLPYLFDAKTGESPRLNDATTFSNSMIDPEPTVRGKSQSIMSHGLFLATGLATFIGQARDPGEAIERWIVVTNAHPWLKTFVLKRKEEKMDRAEFWKKVRPYGVAPLATKIFCQWAVGPIESRLQNFIDNPDSVCAYHFSPYYGGATKLVNHFVNRLKTRTMCCITYGDDQLWAFKLKDGRILLIGPDVSSMDLSTVKATAMRMLRWYISSQPDAPMTSINGIAVWARLAFNHILLLGGTQLVEKEHSLISGIAGTTIINFFNSAGVIAIVEDALGSEPLTEEQFCDRFGKAINEIKRSYNYTFKGSPDRIDTFKDLRNLPHYVYDNVDDLAERGIVVPFLSTVFLPVPDATDRAYLPTPYDMYKLGASLILPPRPSNKIDPMIGRCERIMGVYYSGGWINLAFGAYLRDTFWKYRATCDKSPLMDLGEVNSLGEDSLRELWEMTKDGSVRELPSHEAMTIFCTQPKARLVEYMAARTEGRSASRRVVAAASAASAREEDEDDDDMAELVRISKRAPASSSSSRDVPEEEDEMSELKRMASRAAAPAVAATTQSSAPSQLVPPPLGPAAIEELMRNSENITQTSVKYPMKAMGHSNANSKAEDIVKAGKAFERWRLRKQRAILLRAEAAQLCKSYGSGKRGVAKQWEKLQERLDADSDEESAIAVDVGQHNEIFKQGLRESSRSFGISWADLDEDEELEWDPKEKKWYHYNDEEENEDLQDFIDDAPSNGAGLSDE